MDYKKKYIKYKSKYIQLKNYIGGMPGSSDEQEQYYELIPFRLRFTCYVKILSEITEKLNIINLDLFNDDIGDLIISDLEKCTIHVDELYKYRSIASIDDIDRWNKLNLRPFMDDFSKRITDESFVRDNRDKIGSLGTINTIISEIYSLVERLNVKHPLDELLNFYTVDNLYEMLTPFVQVVDYQLNEVLSEKDKVESMNLDYVKQILDSTNDIPKYMITENYKYFYILDKIFYKDLIIHLMKLEKLFLGWQKETIIKLNEKKRYFYNILSKANTDTIKDFRSLFTRFNSSRISARTKLIDQKESDVKRQYKFMKGLIYIEAVINNMSTISALYNQEKDFNFKIKLIKLHDDTWRLYLIYQIIDFYNYTIIISCLMIINRLNSETIKYKTSKTIKYKSIKTLIDLLNDCIKISSEITLFIGLKDYFNEWINSIIAKLNYFISDDDINDINNHFILSVINKINKGKEQLIIDSEEKKLKIDNQENETVDIFQSIRDFEYNEKKNEEKKRKEEHRTLRPDEPVNPEESDESEELPVTEELPLPDEPHPKKEDYDKPDGSKRSRLVEINPLEPEYLDVLITISVDKEKIKIDESLISKLKKDLHVTLFSFRLRIKEDCKQLFQGMQSARFVNKYLRKKIIDFFKKKLLAIKIKKECLQITNDGLLLFFKDNSSGLILGDTKEKLKVKIEEKLFDKKYEFEKLKSDFLVNLQSLDSNIFSQVSLDNIEYDNIYGINTRDKKYRMNYFFIELDEKLKNLDLNILELYNKFKEKCRIIQTNIIMILNIKKQLSNMNLFHLYYSIQLEKLKRDISIDLYKEIPSDGYCFELLPYDNQLHTILINKKNLPSNVLDYNFEAVDYCIDLTKIEKIHIIYKGRTDTWDEKIEIESSAESEEDINRKIQEYFGNVDNIIQDIF